MRFLLTCMDADHTSGAVALLASHRIASEKTSDGDDAIEHLLQRPFDAVLFDVEMKNPGAAEFIRRVRSCGIRLPVVAIARHISPRDRTQLLDLGADDVITLPIDGNEFAARLRVMVRRSGGFAQSVLRAGPVELHMDCRLATVNQQDLHLSPSEYRVMALLIRRKNTLVSKSAIVDTLYGDVEDFNFNSLAVLMHRLRKRLAAFGVHSLLTTVWGSGYMVRDRIPASSALTSFEPGMMPATSQLRDYAHVVG